MNPTPSANVRRQLQRGREYHEDRLAEERALAERRRKFEMSTRKTAQGDRVPMFADRSSLLDAVESVRAELEGLYDDAAGMAERNARMERAGKPDATRFPSAAKGV